MKLLTEVNRMYDSTRQGDVVFLVFYNALEKVPHKPLSVKQQKKVHHIPNNIGRWMEDWISHRKQWDGKMKKKKKNIKLVKVNIGVPQDQF